MLKSLELFGFKSFADRTAFDFAEGVTAVVGPNGSGKSNVVDGLKWILGDQSAKSLRGKEMTDVIFNGARNRKAAALAEATLSFDNESGFLPVESTEVQVGRRLWRNGDSEYLLNGSPVRLKDIRQLLMGSNAGSAAYSIIEQGRVDQILQANAISRRGIFEEAAGISLYKTRRADFVRRMERVDGMLERLTDMVDQADAQRTALRSQAEKAAKYREISEELRTAWLGLAADDFRLYSEIINTAGVTLDEDKDRVDELNERHAEVESRLERIDHEIADVDRRLREKDREIGTQREQMAGNLTTIRLESERATESQREFLRLKRQRFLAEERAQEGDAEIAHLSRTLEQGEANRRVLADAIDEFDRQAAEVESQVEQLRSDELQIKASIDAQQSRIAKQTQQAADLRAKKRSIESARQSAIAKRAQVDTWLNESRRNTEEAEQRLQETERRLREAEAQQAEVVLRRNQLLDELTAHQSSLSDLRENRSGCDARISVLQDLESRQEGLGIGVKEILRRAQTSEYPPWNAIAGTVADLIDVDLEHAALLEAALGDRAQLILIRELTGLREYLLVHATQINGRVAFRELPAENNVAEFARIQTEADEDTEQPNSDDSGYAGTAIDLSNRPGVVRRADELARGTEGYTNLPQLVLADTWIVETLDDAFALAETGCRFVTLQGEVLDTDNTLTVGTLRNETAVVSRKSELRSLKNELLRLDDKINKEERSLADANESLAEIDAELETAEAEVDLRKSEHAERYSEFATQQREVERQQNDAVAVESEIESLDADEATVEESLAENQSTVAEIETELSELQTSLDSTRAEITATERQLQTDRQQRDAQQLELAKLNERFDALKQSLNRARRDHQTRRREAEEFAGRLVTAREQVEAIDLTILRNRAQLAQRAVIAEAGRRDSEAVLAEKDDIRARRAALAREEAELRKETNRLKEAIHNAEMQVREATQNRDTLVARIDEEYQLNLQEIVDAGTSAYADYLAEYGPEDDSEDEPPRFEEIRDDLESNVERLRRRLKALGSVNTDSLRDLDEIEARYEHLATTLEDLVEAKKHLENLVRRIDQKCKQMFRDTFDIIRENFQLLFRKAFGGGDGDIVLEDAEDVLECGIDIVARPPGKELKSISLLSGGEKTLTAFALLLALFRYRPSPYCILDEVDAALDEANVERLLALVLEFKEGTQFVIITHKKPTMTIADRLFGVTMEESGVSKRMTVKFENVGDNGEFIADDSMESAA